MKWLPFIKCLLWAQVCQELPTWVHTQSNSVGKPCQFCFINEKNHSSGGAITWLRTHTQQWEPWFLNSPTQLHSVLVCCLAAQSPAEITCEALGCHSFCQRSHSPSSVNLESKCCFVQSQRLPRCLLSRTGVKLQHQELTVDRWSN